MTLLIAIDSTSAWLNPTHAPLKFEPGIALAVDTRFSVGTRKLTDRAVKWFELAPFALSAYCGDVAFAETTFRCTAASCIENNKLDNPIYIRNTLQTVARAYFAYLEQKRSPKPFPTTFLCGLREQPSKFRLYALRSDKSFKLERERGLMVIGDYKAVSFVRPLIRPQIDLLRSEAIAFRQAGIKATPDENGYRIEPQKDSDGLIIPIQRLTGSLGIVVDEAIRKAAAESVGGATSILGLTNAGVAPITAMSRSSEGIWKPITADQTHHSLLMNKKATGPFVNADGQIEDSVDVWIS